MPGRPRMVNWLNPFHLAQIGIRAGISSTFGAFADRRDAEAAVRPLDPEEALRFFEYGKSECDSKGEFWFDYLADTGDGWNQTYTMAHLLSQPELDAGKHQALKRGRVLILGGDQVYPTASQKEYEDRLIDPFRTAAEHADTEAARNGGFGDVFAIPGNHDWYDGLRAFLGIFCRFSKGLREGKIIGGRRAPQTRSYFALKLPHDWWLWGVDSQLEGYIDQPQVDYFATISKREMNPNSKLIICSGYPSWTWVDPANPQKRFGSYAYMERLIDNYRNPEVDGSGKLRVSISGDIHHYARHGENGRIYITCGGGGAYTRPTSDCRDHEFDWAWPAPGMPRGRGKYRRKFALSEDAEKPGASSIYPSACQSDRAAIRSLAIAAYNPAFTLFMSFLAASLFGAILSVFKIDQFRLPLSFAAPLVDWEAWARVLMIPWVWLYFATNMLAYMGLADFKEATQIRTGSIERVDDPKVSVRNKCLNVHIRFIVGAIHAATHLAAILAVGIVGYDCFGQSSGWAALAAFLGTSLVAGTAAASVLGLYYWVMFRGFRRHGNHLFSAIRMARYKSMLRLKIDDAGQLTIYPIGIDKTEKWHRWWKPWHRVPIGNAECIPIEAPIIVE